VGAEQRYVRVSGLVRDTKLNLNRNRAAWFTFSSPEIGKSVRTSFIQGTHAAFQLRDLNSDEVPMIALRYVDLDEDLKDRYVVSLLAVETIPTPRTRKVSTKPLAVS